MHHLAVGQMEFPLQHPAVMVRNQQADDYSQRNIFGAAKSKTLLGRARRLVKKCLPSER
jgi:hypothetical protein